jgi:hypothetical protein
VYLRVVVKKKQSSREETMEYKLGASGCKDATCAPDNIDRGKIEELGGGKRRQ